MNIVDNIVKNKDLRESGLKKANKWNIKQI